MIQQRSFFSRASAIPVASSPSSPLERYQEFSLPLSFLSCCFEVTVPLSGERGAPLYYREKRHRPFFFFFPQSHCIPSDASGAVRSSFLRGETEPALGSQQREKRFLPFFSFRSFRRRAFSFGFQENFPCSRQPDGRDLPPFPKFALV